MIDRKLCLLIAIIAAAIILSSCVGQSAADFSAEAYDNGYLNYNAGGRLAYIDHKLYYVAVHDNSERYDNTFIIGKDGVSEAFDTDIIKPGFSIDAPTLYQYKDNLYVNNQQQDFHRYQYDPDTKELTMIDMPVWDYYSEDFSAYSAWDNKGCFPITVECKDQAAYKIEKSNSFTVFQGIIYFTSDGKLYKKLPSANDKAESISKLNGDPWIMLINEKYCYYVDADENTVVSDVLYRYSFDSQKQDKVYQGEVTSINTIDGDTFFSTRDGVYCDNGTECKKISDQQAEGVYIVDKEWIYLTDRNENLYRITHDGSKNERIKTQ